MQRHRVAIASLGLFLACANCEAEPPSEQAAPFDRSLLGGVWAESVDTMPACAMTNLHNTFELSPDGRTLVFKLDRKSKIASGNEVEQYSATVLRSTSQSLFIRYNADIGTLPPGFPLDWEIVFVTPGVYRWHAEKWKEGEVNNVVGVKCFQ